MKFLKFMSLFALACVILYFIFGAFNSPPINIYANAGVNMLTDTEKKILPRVYVPNSLDNTVSVIDPHLYQVINVVKTGKEPQHVVPAYDLKTLWVLNNAGNSAVPINSMTGQFGAAVHVDDPYNMYFTPDGRYAIVVSESHKRLNFYDVNTMMLHDSVPVQCRGLNHMDFTADGKYAVVTCEFSGQLLKFDVMTHQIMGYLDLGMGSHMHSMPQDIRLTPDGSLFYVADMKMNGVHLVNPVTFQKAGFISTGIGTHSIYPSRDGKYFYISNRGCTTMMRCARHGPGSITLLDPRTQQIIANWPIPGGGSPDMGNVTADGKELWLSGRYDAEVYVIDTATGQLLHRIPVGRGPHGLTVMPQPGRYSLGHTGNMR